MSAPLIYGPGSGGNGGTSPTGSGDPTGISTYKTAETNDYNAFQWLAAWGLVLILAVLMNRTRWGHAVIYYALLLCLLLLVLANYQAITSLLAPASGPGGGDNPSPDSPTETLPQGTSPDTAFPSGFGPAPLVARAPTFQIQTTK